MKRPAPNTTQMDTALISHAVGGAGIFKSELYIHATREAQARRAGFKSVAKWIEHRQQVTTAWMDDFMAGKFDD